MVNIGNRLRQLRLSHKLTQSQVAQRVGVSKAMISSYELSTRQPSYEVLIKLAALFKVSTDYLLGVDKCTMINVDGLSDDSVTVIKLMIEALINK